MPIDVKVIRAKDFIKATPNGELDFEASTRLLLQVASVASALSDYAVLLDTRNAESKLSATDLYYLALELQKHSDTFFLRKTAIICPQKRFDKAEFFALCAENRGFQVSAFTLFERAMEWLTASNS